MNSYYSNRIEGNKSRPRVIERAVAGDFDTEPERRAWLQEHVAHVRLQTEIDRRVIDGTLRDPSDPAFLRSLHREFYVGATKDVLTIRHGGRVVRLIPGEWCAGDVEISAHVPPPHETVPMFIDNFHKRFR